MLFRLDYQSDGSPVQDGEQGDFECQHMSTARRRAIQAAFETDRNVVVSRVAGDTVRPALVIRPDGGAEPPAGTKQGDSPDCTAGPDKPPCFCRNCRAARRAR